MKRNALTRREFLALVGAGSAALTIADPLSVMATQARRKPNVVFIIADDLGYGELGCQGNNEIPSPNVDSIARNGIRFTNAYVSCPCCSPTRAGIMTGRYQQRFGHEYNTGEPGSAAPNAGLPLTETTVAQRMKSAGYATCAIGKWHLGHDEPFRPLKRGFDEFFGFLSGAHPYLQPFPSNYPMMRNNDVADEQEYLTDAFTRESASFINRHAKEPFFLYLALNAVHEPLQATAKYLERFSHIKDVNRRTYAAMQSAMDDAVGQTLKAIRDNGLEDDTLIFFLSDNGGPTQTSTSSNLPLRGYKAEVWEGGIRIPFMVQWKGHIPAGQTCGKPIISLDLAPTAAAVAGAKIADANFDGVNLIPFLTANKSQTPHDILYWRLGRRRAIRKGDWKLVHLGSGQPELYNLVADIREKTDLAPQHPDKVKELANLWADWDRQLIEPLWVG